MAPSTNATTTVPAPLSSLAISTPSEDADPHVEVLLGILPDVRDEPLQLAGGRIHIVIHLFVVQQLAGGALARIQVLRELVETVDGAVQPVVQLALGQQPSRRID